MDDSHQEWLGAARRHVRWRTSLAPRVGIILGSGLGGFAAEVQADATLPYSEVPGFPVSTAIGHKGQLTLGRFAGHSVAVLEGRFHLYEGYTVDQVVRPIHLLKALGVEILIVTNAAGGLNPSLRVGDVVVIEDHVNLMWAKLSLGCDLDVSTDHSGGVTAGPLAPAFSSIAGRYLQAKSVLGERAEEAWPFRRLYDGELAERAMTASRQAGASSQRGVYIGMTGPNYETRAEYRWLRQIGDLVGMSTVPEVLAARTLGLRVLGLSVVSNECNPDALEPTDGAHVVAAVARAEGRIRSIVRGVLDGNAGS